MTRVQVVTDSTSDLPAELASALRISVVPCQLLWGEETYRDGVDIPPPEFFRRLATSRELPRTSQPPVSAFLQVYERLLNGEGAEAVVSVHVAGSLSGTVNAAWAASQCLATPGRVAVVDSGQVSMGLGWAAVEAARMAANGAGLAEVARATQELGPRLKTAAMIDSLDNLRKGGRINQFSALLGTALQIKPLVSLDSGQVSIWARVRSRSKALLALVERVRSWGPLAEVAVLHAGAEDLAQTLVARLQDLFAEREPCILPAGSALTSHLGLGAVGLCALVAGDPVRPLEG
ncbi:MAG: DegV family protein [Anaerolineaceae bacterium]|nr:DegV family protein [Anaerolineaceae bacterium]